MSSNTSLPNNKSPIQFKIYSRENESLYRYCKNCFESYIGERCEQCVESNVPKRKPRCFLYSLKNLNGYESEYSSSSSDAGIIKENPKGNQYHDEESDSSSKEIKCLSLLDSIDLVERGDSIVASIEPEIKELEKDSSFIIFDNQKITNIDEKSNESRVIAPETGSILTIEADNIECGRPAINQDIEVRADDFDSHDVDDFTNSIAQGIAQSDNERTCCDLRYLLYIEVGASVISFITVILLFIW